MTARDTSSGFPRRLTGTDCAICFALSLSSGTTSVNISVTIGPGATAFTVIPCWPSSMAQVRTSPICPALVAEYPVRVSSPSMARELMSTIRPNLFAFIASSTPCVSKMLVYKCSLVTYSTSSSFTSSIRSGRITPALCTRLRISYFPASSAIAPFVASTSDRSTSMLVIRSPCDSDLRRDKFNT